jgi:hypothetical protein
MTSATLRDIRELGVLSHGAVRGLWDYIRRGEADMQSWMAVMRLHCRTNGRSTEILRKIMKTLRPAPAVIPAFESMLGNFNTAKVQAIAKQIQHDGYYVFERRIPGAVCDEIAEAARTIKARVGRNPDDPKPMTKFDPANAIAYVYDIPEPEIWQIRAYQRLIADPLFLNLSQAYFGAASALKQANLWWSVALDGVPDTNAAQLFHFDFDPAPIWLKVFFYLTDVTPETGPHVFVKGSHKLRQQKTRELLSRGYERISDDDIVAVYGHENIVEINGAKGTVLVVDTMGFHKGKAPTAGYRLLAQLEYANSPYVPSVSAPLPLPPNAGKELLATRAAYPWVFVRFPAISS